MAYHRPTELAEALELLQQSDLRVLAGGTDIYPTVEARNLPGDILDITAIDALSGIHGTNRGWHIGATTTWSEIAKATLPPAFQALQQAARVVGSLQIQNSGTIAGNLCNASPAADGVPPLLILDAQVEIASTRGVRCIPLGEFIRGVREIDLGSDEIVTGIIIDEPAVSGVSVFEKLGARKYLVISICMVAARIETVDGKISNAAVSVGSCSPVAARLHGLEAALIGSVVGDTSMWKTVLIEQVADILSAIGDIRADAPYRDIAAVELVTRAILRTSEGAV